MKSHPTRAAAHARGPLPRSCALPLAHMADGVVRSDVQVAAASTPAPTASGPPTWATRSAARRARREAPGDRRTRSAIVVATAAPATVPSSTLPYVPLLGTTFRAIALLRNGRTSEPTPIDRLAIV